VHGGLQVLSACRVAPRQGETILVCSRSLRYNPG
jgi:hypothetical protein